MILRLIYTLFLGILIAFFVGLGIDAFYQEPKAPDYPIVLESVKAGCQEDPQITATREKFDQDQKSYQEVFKKYNRNVSMISLIAAIIVLIASLTLFSKIKMIADGILLGGVFTTGYSIIRGLMSEDSKFRFLIATVGLIITLTLGYVKFIRSKQEEATEATSKQ